MKAIKGNDYNGASQGQRQSEALQPGYFLLEERSIADLLQFAKQHAERLRYFNAQNLPEGNWSAFLEGDPAEMAAFLKNPESFDIFPEKKALYSRPHLVLFLVFLQLLQTSHTQINALTQKQLDFYYRQAMAFTTQKAVPDRVHVLAKLLDDQPQLLLPKGLLLQAGTDGKGNPVHYKTDDDLLAHQACIARLMSLYVDKAATDIAVLRLRHHDDPDRGFLPVLQLSYRKAGTAKIPRDYPGNAVETTVNRPFSQEIIDELDALEATVTKTLHLRIAAFQRLMQDYYFWQDEKNYWNSINQWLRGFSTEELAIDDPRDFDENFKKALGFSVLGKPSSSSRKNVFDGIPDVSNLYELSERLNATTEDPLINGFIKERFTHIDSFKEFMVLRKKGLQLLQSIRQILMDAAAKNDITPSDNSIVAYKKDGTLALLVEQVLRVNTISEDAGFLEIERKLSDLEFYFKMKAEDYFFIRHLYQSDPNSTPAWKWQRADALLEKAYQTWQQADHPERTGGQSKPEIIQWNNLYQAWDATKVLATSADANESHSRWKLLGGSAFKAADPENHFAAEIGWGIYSPRLRLAEGERTLTLTFTFQNATFEAQRPILAAYLVMWNAETKNKAVYPFRVEVSSAKGWVVLTKWLAFSLKSDAPVITITVQASTDMDAFAALDPALNAFPCLRFLLSKEALSYKDSLGKQHNMQAYELFKDQLLEKVDLNIQVKGLKNLLLQTKDGSADPKQPFTPFGTQPELGDRFFITHPELATQQLKTLNLHLEWKNMPTEGLTAYYKPYSDLAQNLKMTNAPDFKDDGFKAKIALVSANNRMDISAGYSLIQSVAAALQLPTLFSNTQLPYKPNFQAKLGQETINSDRYLELELSPVDFQHSFYQELTERKGVALTGIMSKTTVDTTSIDKINVYLPPPVEPILKSISVDYGTAFTIDWQKGFDATEDQVVYIEPFGSAPLQPMGQAVRFLPEFEAEGSLYIGLEQCHPPQTISFLYQLAEGSANPDLVASTVQWSFLSNDEWIELGKDQLLKDSTQGLLSSGLLQIHLPATANHAHHRMPAGLHWLRAQVERHTDSLSNCIDIRTQALSATWVDPGQASDHLLQPLPPDSIRQSVDSLPGLSSFAQPYSSFLGKTGEADDQLYRRSSERLRHKRRALTRWDYERLVLEEFPDIYRVKVIPAGEEDTGEEPGTIRIVVIPDIRKRKPFDPFEPKAPVARLQQIQVFLQALAPAFASIRVQNPRFWYLQLRVAVRFYDMNNFGFYAGRLHRELQEYLSPWAFEQSEDIVFGGKIYPSVVVDFIETRPYVDYLDRPGMELLERRPDGAIRVLETPPIDKDGLLYVDQPDIVVVSARQHFIEYLPLPQETTVHRIRQGIGFAKIDFDFKIA